MRKITLTLMMCSSVGLVYAANPGEPKEEGKEEKVAKYDCVTYDVSPSCVGGPMLDTVCWTVGDNKSYWAAMHCIAQNMDDFESAMCD